MKKFFTCLSFLLFTLAASAQTYNGGVWYSLFQNQEFSQGSIGTLTKEFDVFPPTASSMSFQWKNKKFWFNGTFGSVDLNFYESTDGSSYGEGQQVVNCGVGTDKTSYQKDSYTIINPSQLQKFKFTLGTSYGAWVSYLTLPLAKHILLSGGDYGKTSVSKTFTQATRIGESTNIRADFRSFLTAGNISISLSEGDAEVFRLGSADNTSGVLESSAAGKTYAVGSNACASANGTAAACANGQLGKIGNYSFQIYFCPKAAGEATGKITITDGTSTATITVTGTGIKMETLEVDVPLSFCAGGATEFHGITYDAAGNDEIEAIGDIRDTIYHVTVVELQPTFGTDTKTITVGAAESWNGIDLSEYTVGQHEIPFETTNAVGCDSTVTLTLTVNKLETIELPVDLKFCAGGSEWYRGVEYSEAGVFDVPVEGATRDTLYKVNVTVLQPSSEAVEMEMTVGDDQEWNGIALKDSTVGVYTIVYETTNVSGCDSTVTLTLTVNKMDTLKVDTAFAFCEGGSEEFHGKTYTEAIKDTILAIGETRDTLYFVNVTVLQPSFDTAEMEITVGDEVEWNGIALKDSTVGVHYVEFVTTNVAGCDSTVTLTLTVNKMDTLEVYYPIGFCTGDSAEYRGKWYYQSGEDKILVEDAICDTVINVTIAVLPVDFVELNTDSLHIGDTLFLGDGLWYLVGDEPEQLTDTAYVMEAERQFDIMMTATNEFGCDSVIVRHVVVETKPVDPETPTAIDQYEQAAPAVKELRNGVLYIRRNDALYTTEGRRVE